MSEPVAQYPGCDPNQFTSFFGLFVQGVLGTVALSFLVLKRFREPIESRRSWPVWILDTSKQVIGMLFVHFANVAWASYVSGKFVGDACSLYLLSFLFDSSLGLAVIFISLQLVDLANTKLNWWMLRVGTYDKGGKDVSINAKSLRPWAIQTFIFLSISVYEKFLITLILTLPVFKRIKIQWFNWIHQPKVELFITMFMFPTLINIFIFWITDNLLMRHEVQKHKVLLSTDEDSSDQELLEDEPNPIA